MCFPARRGEALRISLLALGVVAGDLTPPFPPTSTEVAVPVLRPASFAACPLTILRICCRGHCIRNVLHTFAGSGSRAARGKKITRRKPTEIHTKKKPAAIKMEINAATGQNENSHNNGTVQDIRRLEKDLAFLSETRFFFAYKKVAW